MPYPLPPEEGKEEEGARHCNPAAEHCSLPPRHCKDTGLRHRSTVRHCMLAVGHCMQAAGRRNHTHLVDTRTLDRHEEAGAVWAARGARRHNHMQEEEEERYSRRGQWVAHTVV